jgi:5-methylcytosine-specific restriction endonuclease McrA
MIATKTGVPSPKKGIPTGMKSWNNNRDNRKCLSCNSEFETTLGVSGKTYCSVQCYWVSLIGFRTGEANHNWKGGVTSKNEKARKSPKYKRWAATVKRRDNYTCQICGVRNKKGLGKTILLHSDHIKPFSLYPELRFELDNGRTLCFDCHKQTETYGGRAVSYGYISN